VAEVTAGPKTRRYHLLHLVIVFFVTFVANLRG